MTLHWTGGWQPAEGDVMERVGPAGEPTRSAPMLVLGTRLITRGTCAWPCSPPCRRFRVSFIRIDPATVPSDARIILTTRGPRNPSAQ